MAAVVLVAAAAVVLLRIDGGGSDPPRRAVAVPTTDPTTDPTVTSPAPVPPFDGRPGRTPIPAPAQTYNQLSGPLPVTGPPAKPAASRAVDLVLGRFCDDPARYTYTLDALPDGWREVRVLVFALQSGGSGPVLQLALTWTGRSYRWLGPLILLRGC